ncbi:hypothetical protein BV25DRAFT_1823787 [Artomyces pyxidatus]|uniref:Uncharacterized protein n=1 Tax=Artomyces pyxidatus TaxID=48021 RepID=A0ACB8T735_9AGAM|nr:hypothetical protein BV25DRAFT_1823787 [Artomyces pyxidatus]
MSFPLCGTTCTPLSLINDGAACYCTSPEPGVDHIHRHVSRIPRPMTSSSRFRPQRSPFPHHLVSLIHLLEQSYSARISGVRRYCCYEPVGPYASAPFLP